MNLIIFVVLGILLILFIIDYFSNQNRKIHDMFLGTGFLFLTASFVDINDITKAIIDFANNNPQSLDVYFDKDINYIYIILGIILIVVGLILKYRKSKQLLNLYTYKEKTFSIKISDDFNEESFDLISLYQAVYKNDCCYNILLEEFVRRLEKYSIQNINVSNSYTGIISLPFALLAGTYLKNIRFDNFYEFHKEIQKYQKLNNKMVYPKLNIEKIINNKKELLIAVGITKIISSNDLKQFKNNDIIIINIEDQNYRDNKIYSKNQLHNYTKEVYSMIKNNSSYQRINIVLATQSCLAIELGKMLDDKNDTEIVCYHYENKKYTWGIIVSGKSKGKKVLK